LAPNRRGPHERALKKIFEAKNATKRRSDDKVERVEQQLFLLGKTRCLSVPSEWQAEKNRRKN